MHQRPPDAVLLDLVMPIMDGQAFLGACRADPAYRMLPVALFSTLGSEAMTLDVQARVPKPFELEELTDAIALLVGQPVETAIAPAPPEWAAAPLNDAVLLRRRARGTHLTIRRSCMTIRAASACLQRATARLQRAYQPRALPAAMPRLG
jgi:CheY-like chemotaxis protein